MMTAFLRSRLSPAGETAQPAIDNQVPSLFASLVLCTSNSLDISSEDWPDSAEYDTLHRYLVKFFNSAFMKLVIDLEVLGYEVMTEFYVDTLIEQDYVLSVGGPDEEDEVLGVVEEFHNAAEAILMGIPDALED